MSDVWQTRYERERRARKAAEALLEDKSRALYLKNEELRDYVGKLEITKRELENTAGRLTAALNAAAAASQAKSQFLATMSHELRTPLNAILGFSDVLKSELFGPVGSARYLEYSADIFDSGTHLLNLINDILDISKFDAGQLELYEEPIDIDANIAAALHLMDLQAVKARVHLKSEAARDLPMLNADKRRLRQILLNLISNAVKFTPAGGHVRVSAQCQAGGLAIAVTDNGIGMRAEDIPRALERFGQIDGDHNRRYQGTGLGLPLTKHLVEMHGGRLSIDSELGVGTAITVLFPPERLLMEGTAA